MGSQASLPYALKSGVATETRLERKDIHAAAVVRPLKTCGRTYTYADEFYSSIAPTSKKLPTPKRAAWEPLVESYLVFFLARVG